MASSQILSIFCSAFYFTCILHVRAHSFGTGSCPQIRPVQSFDMEKFNGSWYVIQKFTSSKCLMYNFTEGEDGKMRIVQTSQHSLWGSNAGVYNFTYTGVLTFPNLAKEPGRMRVKFPASVAGSADYFVFMTDYDNYGVIFTCQELPVGHRKSFSILSRTPSLEKEIISQIHQKIRSEGLDPKEFDTIDHSKCGYGNSNVNIDDKTFRGGTEKNPQQKLKFIPMLI